MRIVLAIVLCCLAQASHHRHRAPVIDLQGADQLTATIREDETILNTVPVLATVEQSGEVCEYVLSSPSGGFIPFEASVIDRTTGGALLRTKEAQQLDCKQKEYLLTIQAVRCDGEIRSEPVPLRVTVKDTNNHAPEFESPWFTYTVEEGRLHSEIAHLKASDADCGHPFGEICEYSITNGLKDLPFAINNQGVLRNTVPLNYTQSKSYILTVVAHDCGQRSSKSVLVTVNVKEACVAGIHNAEDRVAYTAASGSKLLLPDATATVCEKESSCEVSAVTATITLKAGHVTSGCSRDTLFNNQTVASCGLSPSTVALLHSEDVASDDDDVIEKNGVANFDGSTNAIVVTEDKMRGLIPDHFALSFSMKHGKGSKKENSGKQHILCESDSQNMNRHHFSVYVRHCKLEVVLRREAGSAAEFRAAEWRWDIPQVCDNEWHSYSVLFNGIDDVTLMLDGSLLKADERNPEILDDWPLHKIKTSQKTKMVVGACWHGRHNTMAQFFKGQLSALHLLTGSTESTSAIECAHRCPEQLQYSGIDELQDGQSATFTPDHSSLTLKAANAKQIAHMLNMVAYVNTQETPATGHRAFSVSAQAECKNGKKVELSRFKGFVFVSRPVQSRLSISGSAEVNADHHQVKIGTAMTEDIRITASETDSEGHVADVTSSSTLDFCKVHLKPSRDMDVEYFSSPASLISALQIEFEHDKEGLLLRGQESVKGYVDVLSKVHYFNTRPDTYSKRIYSVQCGMNKGKVMSNEFVVTMTIVPPAVPEVTSSASSESIDSLDMVERHFEPAFDQLGSSRLQNILEMDLPRPKALMSRHGYDVGQGAMAGGAVAVVVVVCVGFLLVLLVVGVMKMKDTTVPKRRKNRKQDDGLHWDDSGMNITVNPLDDVEKNGAEEEYTEDEESTDGESECSFRDEDVTDEEEEPEVLPHLEGPRSGLEWDDEAALTPNSRSYRV